MKIVDYNKESSKEEEWNILFDIPGTNTSILDRTNKYEIEKMIEDLQVILKYAS